MPVLPAILHEQADASGRLLSRRLNLARWQGVYEGVQATWLRWATAQGELLPTQEENYQVEQQLVDQERRRAEAAEAEAARLRALLAGRDDGAA